MDAGGLLDERLLVVEVICELRVWQLGKDAVFGGFEERRIGRKWRRVHYWMIRILLIYYTKGGESRQKHIEGVSCLRLSNKNVMIIHLSALPCSFL